MPRRATSSNVTVLVSLRQAQELILAQEIGVLTLALRSNLDGGRVENLTNMDPHDAAGRADPVKRRPHAGVARAARRSGSRRTVMKSHWWLSTDLRAWAVAVAAAAQAAAPAAPPREVRLLVGDQFVLEPGFAVGDIAVARSRRSPTTGCARADVPILLLGVGERPDQADPVATRQARTAPSSS